MISTEIDIQDYISLSEKNIRIIKVAAKQDAIKKLMNVTDDAVYEFDLNFEFQIMCKTTITKKIKK